jgi:hypothetical protein
MCFLWAFIEHDGFDPAGRSAGYIIYRNVNDCIIVSGKFDEDKGGFDWQKACRDSLGQVMKRLFNRLRGWGI